MKEVSATGDHELRLMIRACDLSGLPVCLHSSLKSFGYVVGGAAAVVNAFLAEGCTLMVPTYTYWAWTAAPDNPDLRPERNAWDYDLPRAIAQPFRPDATETSTEMGVISAAVAARQDRVRGSNPGVSFSAVGPLAHALIDGQSARDPNAPLRALALHGGFVVLAGVDLDSMTLLHAAEEAAGRVPFMRYALTVDGIMPFATGGCSKGFRSLARVLEPICRTHMVGASRWCTFPASDALRLAAEAILADPAITRCDDPDCGRCDAAIAGGPILRQPWRGSDGNVEH